MGSRILTLFGGKRLDPLWPLKHLPELQAWYTFDDAAYLRQNSDGTGAVAADGDPIGYCMDRSGNSRHIIQATTGFKPTWKTGIRRGRAVARLDGDDHLDNGVPGALLRNVPGATAVVVLASSADTEALLLRLLIEGSTSRLIVRRKRTGARSVSVSGRRLNADAIQHLDSADNVFALGAWGVDAYRLDYAHSDAFAYHQAGLVASTTSWLTDGNVEDTNPAHLRIGAGDYGLAGLTGDIAEIIICGVDIGLPLLQRLWNEYLKPKWGVPA